MDRPTLLTAVLAMALVPIALAAGRDARTAGTAAPGLELGVPVAGESVVIEVRARHILLRLDEAATAAEVETRLALAAELRRRIVAGESFAELAREYSEDPGTRQQGGDLGWFQRGMMVRPFEEAVFSLGIGDVSAPVRTPFGVHLVRVEDIRTR